MPKLYHASPSRIVGDVLEPRPQRTHNGRAGVYLFAGPSFECAVAYTLKTPICKGTFALDDGVFGVVFETKDDFLESFRGGVIYEVPDDNFTPVSSPEGEYVSEVAVPLYKTKRTAIPNVRSACGHAVQVFFMKEGVSIDEWYKAAEAHTSDDKYHFVENLISAGKVEHYNAEIGVKPYDFSKKCINETDKAPDKPHDMKTLVGGGGIGGGASFKVERDRRHGEWVKAVTRSYCVDNGKAKGGVSL